MKESKSSVKWKVPALSLLQSIPVALIALMIPKEDGPSLVSDFCKIVIAFGIMQCTFSCVYLAITLCRTGVRKGDACIFVINLTGLVMLSIPTFMGFEWPETFIQTHFILYVVYLALVTVYIIKGVYEFCHEDGSDQTARSGYFPLSVQ